MSIWTTTSCPSGRSPGKRGPARLLADAELVSVAIAQILLRCGFERRWMRTAPARIGHLFPRLPGQSEYTRHLRDAAPALLAASTWLARPVSTRQESLWLIEGTPLRCGASRVTVNVGGVASGTRPGLAERWSWRGGEDGEQSWGLAEDDRDQVCQWRLPPSCCGPPP
ncbi:hypothetical protein GCM10022402_37970 [Salinactinospora qingdaonensis]|uniref:Uncharacterized protein n=1 Tax=Salinactinospora qingdaonensis TaxID=702744 RepID=A0ABP7G6K2_9ACTN